MRGRHTLISRKNPGFLCAVLLLASAVCLRGHANEADSIQASTDTAAQLYHAGDVLAAKQALEELVLKEPTESSRLAYRYALITLIEVCKSVYDKICVLQNSGRLVQLPLSPEQDDLQTLENAYFAAVSMSSMPPDMIAVRAE